MDFSGGDPQVVLFSFDDVTDNVYIDDIVKKVKNVNVTLFADDCCILYSDNNLNALMNVVNDDLGCTYEWTVANKLSLNLSKCHYMLFTRKKSIHGNDFSININNEGIERVSSTNFLGII